MGEVCLSVCVSVTCVCVYMYLLDGSIRLDTYLAGS